MSYEAQLAVRAAVFAAAVGTSLPAAAALNVLDWQSRAWIVSIVCFLAPCAWLFWPHWRRASPALVARFLDCTILMLGLPLHLRTLLFGTIAVVCARPMRPPWDPEPEIYELLFPLPLLATFVGLVPVAMTRRESWIAPFARLVSHLSVLVGLFMAPRLSGFLATVGGACSFLLLFAPPAPPTEQHPT